MKKKYFYKNIKVTGFYPYVAKYEMENGKYFVICISDGGMTKKETLELAKQNIDYLNRNNIEIKKEVIH